jgi:peptide/nickel transport system permease protein
LLKYTINRLLLAVPTLLLVSVIVFSMIRLIPGDPAQLLLGDLEDPAALARLRDQWGLDQPVAMQYLMWLGNVVRGDLGVSILQQRPVGAMLVSGLGVTASLVLPAMLLASLLAIPAGMLAAWKQNTLTDVAVVTMAIAFLSVPSFWLGLLFLLVFGVWLDLLPVVGYVPLVDDFLQGASYLLMPVCALALIETGVIIRMARASTIEVLRLEYVTHARAKGLDEKSVAFRHVLKNAMAPTWTMIGLTLGSLLGGAVVIETVFTLPGLGRLIVDSIFARDYPVIQGCMLLITAIYVVVNLVIELCYPLLDPRVRPR